MKGLVKTSLFLSSFALAGAFSEFDANSSIYVGIGVGTTGGYVNAAYYYKNIIGLRAEYSGIPSSLINKGLDKLQSKIGIDDLATSMVDVAPVGGMNTSLGATMRAYGFDLSVRPFAGKFRIDAGVRNTDISFSMGFNGQVDFNKIDFGGIRDLGQYLSALDPMSVSGHAKFVMSKGWKPYIGIGWDFNPVAGFDISLSVGAILTINPWEVSNLSVSVNGGVSSSTYDRVAVNKGYDSWEAFTRTESPAVVREVRSNIEKVESEIKEVNDELGNLESLRSNINSEIHDARLGSITLGKLLRFYPVIKLGIGYQFNIG